MVKTEILFGDEAVALGAVHAGLTGAYSYPGTPASKIVEYLIRVAPQYPHLRASRSVFRRSDEALRFLAKFVRTAARSKMLSRK
jgi:pyruvate/2-oxoacid:ferredoxin oxidoreductase alpha subunit